MKQAASGISEAFRRGQPAKPPFANAVIAGAAIALWAAVPPPRARSRVGLLVFSGLYTIAGLGVTFLLGQCGIVSLAQSGFYGIGAYATAYGTTVLGLPIPVCIVMGIIFSGLIAAAVGIP